MDRVEAALLAMKKLKAKVYVTGHLGRAGTLQDVQDNLDLFYDMRTTLLGIFKNANANFALAVQTVGDKYANNKWLVFDTFEQIQVRPCSFPLRRARHMGFRVSIGSGTVHRRLLRRQLEYVRMFFLIMPSLRMAAAWEAHAYACLSAPCAAVTCVLVRAPPDGRMRYEPS
jgi:hypothetical protein